MGVNKEEDRDEAAPVKGGMKTERVKNGTTQPKQLHHEKKHGTPLCTLGE